MTELSDYLNIDLELIFIIFARLSASLTLLPAFGERAVPMRVKLGLALAFTGLVFSISDLSGTQNDKRLSEVLLIETTNGILIGFLFRSLVFILQITGTIAAQSVSLSQSFGAGMGIDPQPAFSTLFVVGCLALLAHLDWHVHITRFYIDSFIILPMGQWPLAGMTTEWGIEQVSRTFAYGLSLATPFVIGSLIYNLGLGFINKAMPQLMVALVGAPAASFLGLTILLMTSALILDFWARTLVPATLSMTGSLN